jgi:hypothetical protein
MFLLAYAKLHLQLCSTQILLTMNQLYECYEIVSRVLCCCDHAFLANLSYLALTLSLLCHRWGFERYFLLFS